MQTLIMLTLFGVFSSGCVMGSIRHQMKQEQAVKEYNQRQSDRAEYGDEVADAKNFMHREHLIKMKTLKGKALQDYISQTTPTKKVLVITEDPKTKSIKGEVITTYDND